jgi:hypothetical protein
MTTFQAVGLPLIGLLALITLVAIIRHAINGRAGTGWLLLWIAAAGAIAKPEITAVIAHSLGIGRGTDLVLYCSILGMLVAFFLVYTRFKRLEREITRLVRHLAIREVEERER